MSAELRTFGKYLLDEEIARGGMSRVFLARLRGLGGFEKKLIVKQVLPELARDPRFVSMFVNEAKTLVQMSHPHIAPVYELGIVDGVYFLAMEYVEGATLAEILPDGPLAPPLVAHLGAEICDALHYAHTRFDIIHRDVTPRNVIVDSAGHCRLLDFGIAAPATDSHGDELFGTPGYLSPEQLRKHALGPTSDVFALGCVLYEALTAKRAFPGNNVDETKELLLSDAPLEVVDVPPGLADAIARAVAKDTTERFASARELGKALRRWLATTRTEDAGQELGARAEQALERRERGRRSPVPDEPATSERRDPSGVVRTLATSRVLDAMLEGSEPPLVYPRDSVPSEETPLEDAKPALHFDEAEATDEPETRAMAHRVRKPRRMLPWAAGGIALAAAAAGWLAWPTAPAPIPPPPPIRPIDRHHDETPPPVPRQPDPPPIPQIREPDPPPPIPPPAPGQPGTLVISASPWAEVFLDNRSIGLTPVRDRRIGAGRHTVELVHEALGHRARTSFRTEPGQHVRLNADMNADSPTISVTVN